MAEKRFFNHFRTNSFRQVPGTVDCFGAHGLITSGQTSFRQVPGTVDCFGAHGAQIR